MVKKSSKPMLRIALGFAGGIAFYAVVPVGTDIIYGAAAALFLTVLFLAYVIFFHANHRLSVYTGTATVLAFLCAGMLAAHTDRSRRAAHLPTDGSYYVVQVGSTPQTTDRHSMYMVETLAIYREGAWSAGQGKGLLYIRDDTTGTMLPGARLLVRGKADTLPPTLNPGAFDYKTYLNRQGIYYRDFVRRSDISILPQRAASMSLFFLRINRNLRTQIHRMTDDPEHRAVASAMLLGDKKDLPEDLRSAYSAAGASHILAVSGLHVGIIYLALHTLLAGFRRRAGTRVFFYTTALLAIWMFAAITAFSPSVTRAGLMISFVLVGQAVRSGTRILNSLSAAAFLMLLYDPDVLFDVGFQLSFGAVAGIALFNHGMYHSLRFGNRIIDYLWKIIALSIAVQLAIAPLVAFYFHQFPVLFPVTNIVVIPATGLILVSTLTLLPLWKLFGGLSYTDTMYDILVGTLNGFVRTIESLPFSHLDRIHISLPETLLLTCMLGCTAGFLLHRSGGLLAAASLSAMLLLAGRIEHGLSLHRRQQLVVYSYPRTVLIDFIRGKNWAAYAADTSALQSAQTYVLEPARIEFDLAPRHRIPLEMPDLLQRPGWDCLVFGGKKIIVVTSRDITPLHPLPSAPALLIVGRRITDRAMARLLAIGPGHLLVYGTALSHTQLQLILEDRGTAGWTDLSRGAFSWP